MKNSLSVSDSHYIQYSDQKDQQLSLAKGEGRMYI